MSKAALAMRMAEDFHEWYTIYPKHAGRGAAVNSYTRARKNGASAEELTAGARRYAAERKGQDAQFTKAPATWLNQECWTDEAVTTASLGPWSKDFHKNDVRAVVPHQYQWCNPPAELESPEEESA